MVWAGRELKDHLVPAPCHEFLPSTRAGCSMLHPNWLNHIPTHVQDILELWQNVQHEEADVSIRLQGCNRAQQQRNASRSIISIVIWNSSTASPTAAIYQRLQIPRVFLWQINCKNTCSTAHSNAHGKALTKTADPQQGAYLGCKPPNTENKSPNQTSFITSVTGNKHAPYCLHNTAPPK